MSSRPLAGLRPRGFVPDVRFIGAVDPAKGEVQSVAEGDPLEQAWQRGFVEGEKQATQLLDKQLTELRERFAGLDDAFTRLGEQDADTLREKLRETVVALCEKAIEPLALDHQALARRIERASAMLMRAADDRRIKINPDDLELVRGLVDSSLILEADPSLARGALRIETEQGGIEDGPDTWQHIIRETLNEC